ncbi:MAG: transporter substrate-binding domain-containing protein [Pseudomonadota bacterium]
MNDKIRNELAPHGRLRAGINMSNFLLVTGRSNSGEPQGVSPDMARAIAERLGVDVEYITFDTPAQVTDASTSDIWDIANIGAEPERARTITFTPAYAEIEATYIVAAGSSLQTIDDVDKPGVKIVAYGRGAYGLWLADNLKYAELIKVDGMDASFQMFVEQNLDALAGLRPRLIQDVERLPGARLLDGKFSSVQQAIGTKPSRQASAEFLCQFVAEAKASGFVQELIAKHGVEGKLTVAS